jgi:hypothetical protein
MVRDFGPHSYPKAADTAPFATQIEDSADHVDGDTVPDSEKRALREHRYRTNLEEIRKQAGIISEPSSQLQAAEKALAEVSHGSVIVGYIVMIVCFT